MNTLIVKISYKIQEKVFTNHSEQINLLSEI